MKYSHPRRPATEVVLSLALAGLSHTAFAQLDQFDAEVQSLDARFVQERIDEDGFVVELETATGHFQMARPDRFRWHQELPFELLVVADGELVWEYDVDLEEAECFPYSELATSPYRILGGEGQIDEDFAVRELPPADGRQRVELKPHDAQGADFVSATVSFESGVPVLLELLDGLRQTTRVTFADIDVNAEFADGTFEFVPPDGVNIVCEID